MKWTTPTGQWYTLYRDMLENQPHLMIAAALRWAIFTIENMEEG